jgi:methylglutamate dehydrogenase subunit A
MNTPNPTPHNQWYPFQNRPTGKAGDMPVNPAVIPLFDVAPLPESARFVVVGAGIHGMSTAWHLAMQLERWGRGKGSEVVLLDKQGPGAGATGLACGCVRNMYMTGPLHGILRESVAVWESDPVNFGFQQVGYVSIGEANQEADYIRIHKSQNDQGYPSDLYLGAEARAHLKAIWPDFNTEKTHCVLHERPSGYAGTHMAVWGLDQKCRQWGVQRVFGAEVTGYDMQGGRARAVHTSMGDIRAEVVVIAPGAWLPMHWDWLGMPNTIDMHYPDGGVETAQDMWTYWRLLEGEVYLDKASDFRTADGKDSPVLHVELMDTPVVAEDGRHISDQFYMYTRYAAERVGVPGLQGGTVPIKMGPKAEVEPYGHLNDLYQADDWFADYYCATLSYLFGRFKGVRGQFKERRNGGIGAFTPDNVPIFDFVKDNVFMMADSNHGFKMIGAGNLAAQALVTGNKPADLVPFSMDRYAKGATFGDRNSNSPWV